MESVLECHALYIGLLNTSTINKSILKKKNNRYVTYIYFVIPYGLLIKFIFYICELNSTLKGYMNHMQIKKLSSTGMFKFGHILTPLISK